MRTASPSGLFKFFTISPRLGNYWLFMSMIIIIFLRNGKGITRIVQGFSVLYFDGEEVAVTSFSS